MKNNKKIKLMAPILTIAGLGATAVPLVTIANCSCSVEKYVMSTERTQKAKIASVNPGVEAKTTVIKLECTSTVAEEKICSVEIKSGNQELMNGTDYLFDYDTNEITITEEGAKKDAGQFVIDVGVGTTFKSLGEAFSDLRTHWNEQKVPVKPIGLKGKLYKTNGVVTTTTEMNAFCSDLWEATYKNQVVSSVSEGNSFYAYLNLDAGDFSAEMEAAMPKDAKHKIFAHTDKDGIFLFVQIGLKERPAQELAVSYNGCVRKHTGWAIQCNPEADTEYVVDQFYWDEKDMTAVNINTDDCSIPLTTFSRIFAKSEKAYNMTIKPASAVTGHFELSFKKRQGEKVVIGISDQKAYEANTEANVAINIDLSKWSLMDVHHDVRLKFVPAA